MSSSTNLDTVGFRRLLDRWNTHQDLRHDGAELSTLIQSRLELDAARAEVRRSAS